ncbi:MAG: hypothetical protein BA872_04875 [Desulfobacterales bacterium C00003060]|nr:MAG: hypothetical protein BA872_04875 [Desulfobacterales bacterium C00003060]
MGEILEDSGAISKKDVYNALVEQKRLKERRVGEIISEQENVPQETIEETIGRMIKAKKMSPHAKIGEILIAASLVTAEQVEQALASQAKGKKIPLGALLIEGGLVTEEEVLRALATKFRLTYFDFEDFTLDDKAIALISPEIVQKFRILPIKDAGNCLVVATSDPSSHSNTSEALRFHANRRIEMVVSTSESISNFINSLYGKDDEQVENILDELGEEELDVEEEEDTYHSGVDESDSKVIRLVNKVLVDGYRKNVSDIHIEPGLGRDPVQVRYRIDGICHKVHVIPKTYSRALVARIKILSNLDITESRRPQSGKMVARFDRRKVEFRVEVTPTVGGLQDVVLRILASAKPLPLDHMGFSPANLIAFEEVLAKPYGLILCVGPTGSGKTTTLHSALGHINTPERKIWTAEDPVEITQPGLRQVQVHSKIGFTFQSALRSFLRADPDVIMIGEMRDIETAKISIEASLTGHLVLSTLHTNTAPETVMRLIEMGLDPISFADALLAVLAQRLARRLCVKCKKSYHPDKKEYEDLVMSYGEEYFRADKISEYSEDLTLMRKTGCISCGKMGYLKRLGIHEMLVGTEEIKIAIKKKADMEVIRNQAIADGMRTLRMDGIRKIFEGLIDLEQVKKVCI